MATEELAALQGPPQLRNRRSVQDRGFSCQEAFRDTLDARWGPVVCSRDAEECFCKAYEHPNRHKCACSLVRLMLATAISDRSADCFKDQTAPFPLLRFNSHAIMFTLFPKGLALFCHVSKGMSAGPSLSHCKGPASTCIETSCLVIPRCEGCLHPEQDLPMQRLLCYQCLSLPRLSKSHSSLRPALTPHRSPQDRRC